MAIIAITELQKQRLDRFDQPEAVQDLFSPCSKCLGIVLVDELEMPGLFVGVAADVSHVEELSRIIPILSSELKRYRSTFIETFQEEALRSSARSTD